MDLNEIRKLAGLNMIVESDEDDGMSASERALVDKAEKDLAKKGIKVKNVDPDKDMAALAKKAKKDDDDEDEKPAKKEEKAAAPAKKEVKKAAVVAKKEEKKEEPKKEVKAEEKKEEKAEAPAAVKAARGRKAGEKASAMSSWLQANKGATRKSFMDYASDKHGMSKHHANTLFYSLKRRLAEYYVVTQKIGGRTLAEYSSFDRPQWVMFENEWAPNVMIFETEAKAKEAVVKLVAEGWDGEAVKVVAPVEQ